MAKSTTTTTEPKKRAPRTKKVAEETIHVVPSSRQHESVDDFVFMEKTMRALEAGLKTGRNVILYGPGGYGKSELTYAYLKEIGIEPFVLTMGQGMTADRMFGGIDIKELELSGKINYLVENSLFNHEFVILEEMLDAPDYILEQLKDSLSSGWFRNGTQQFEIKTKFIVACTNKTRDEYAKNASIRALMERFPIEHNVVWDNHNETAYTTLLERKWGRQVDPIIPFLLQEYATHNILISPRIAIDAYTVYEQCGPDSLIFIAEFAKKTSLITDTLKKYESTVKFKQIGVEVEDLVLNLKSNDARTSAKQTTFIADYEALHSRYKTIKGLSVNDSLASVHAAMVKKVNEDLVAMKEKYEGLKSIASKKEEKVDAENQAPPTPPIPNSQF